MLKAYFKCTPKKIIEDVCKLKKQRHANILGIEFLIDPFVYPSDRFRSSHFLVEEFSGSFKGKTVCDMGCGPGIVGLIAAYDGASKVVQVDINPHAVENAKNNREYHEFDPSLIQIYESNCFDQVPMQKFDYILFNLPFHSDPISTDHPIDLAFIDPEFQSVEKFLSQSRLYLNGKGKLVIAFSNRGDTSSLEKLFSKYEYQWQLWKQKHKEAQFDSRLYLLTL